jgi:hypothetical protein
MAFVLNLQGLETPVKTPEKAFALRSGLLSSNLHHTC